METRVLEGNLQKMQTELANPIKYTLKLGEDKIDMTSLVGSHLKLHFTGVINCVNCGRVTKK